MSFAFFFPGQGSQSLNMMDGFAGQSVVKNTFDEASAVLGQDLWAMINGTDADLIGQTESARQGQDQSRKRRFTHPAEAERGERDAELCHRKGVVEMLRELLGVFCAAAALRNEGLKARGADLHAAELRRNKEAVHEDQKGYKQYIQ